MDENAEKDKSPETKSGWQLPEPVFRSSEGRGRDDIGNELRGTHMSEQDTEINNKEESIVEEFAKEDIVDTSTRRGRFSAFTLFFIVMVLVGLVVAAVLLYSGSKVAPAVQESMNSNSK